MKWRHFVIAALLVVLVGVPAVLLHRLLYTQQGLEYVLSKLQLIDSARIEVSGAEGTLAVYGEAEDRDRPLLELRIVLLGQAEETGDDLGRVRKRELADEIHATAAFESVDELVADPPDEIVNEVVAIFSSASISRNPAVVCMPSSGSRSISCCT